MKVVTKKGVVRNVLNAKLEYALFKKVEAEYVASDLTDAEFAEKATKDLGVTYTEGNIAGARRMLGITPKIKRNLGVYRSAQAKGLVARLSYLETLVRSMRDELGMPNVEQ